MNQDIVYGCYCEKGHCLFVSNLVIFFLFCTSLLSNKDMINFTLVFSKDMINFTLVFTFSMPE